MAEVQDAVRHRYLEALDSFVAKVKQDSYIIAAILCGSLSHDSVWHKSDIDIVLVGRDEKRPMREYACTADGINIHVLLISRSRFKQELEQAFHSSFFYSYIAKSRLLYSLDPSLDEYYAGINHVGAGDRERGLLLAAAGVLPVLTKAEKWLYHKHDPAYSFLWLMYLVSGLATIEVLLHNEVPGREALQQAMEHNPEFFRAIYFELLERPKTEASVGAAIEAVNAYLDRHAAVLFQPLLEYLAAAGGPRSMTEIDDHFRKRLNSEMIILVCEWLAQRGTLRQIATPLRLTEKSRATVDELAFFYDPQA